MATDRDHPCLVWVWRSGVKEVGGQTGFVECMISVARKLIASGVAQSTKLDGRMLYEIDDPEAIKALEQKAKPDPAPKTMPILEKPPEPQPAKPQHEPPKNVAVAVEEPQKKTSNDKLNAMLELEKKLMSEGGGKIKFIGKK